VITWLGQVPHISAKQEPMGTAGARFSTGRMPFLSPNQQCQSTVLLLLLLVLAFVYQPIFQRLLLWDRPGAPQTSKEEPLWTAGTRFLQTQCPVSPKQQCQSAKGVKNYYRIKNHLLI